MLMVRVVHCLCGPHGLKKHLRLYLLYISAMTTLALWERQAALSTHNYQHLKPLLYVLYRFRVVLWNGVCMYNNYTSCKMLHF